MNINTFTPYRLLLSLSTHRLLDCMSDKLYLTLLYFFRMHKFINWQSPRSYTEKLQWLKINDRNPLYNTMVDKLLVRAYVSAEIGEKYLVPLVGYYNSYNDIDFSTLPNEFALKCTHGSHCSIVCFDKNTFDIERNRKLFEEWYNHEYFWAYREWPYKDLKPKIICEQLLKGEDGSVPTDYKVFCFNGKARFIKLDLARYSNHQRVFYDLTWEKYELGWGKIADANLPKPKLLDKMIELSEKLAKPLPQARIDWYISNNNLYFGEITFFDAGGFEKFDDYNKDLKVGALLNINKYYETE